MLQNGHSTNSKIALGKSHQSLLEPNKKNGIARAEEAMEEEAEEQELEQEEELLMNLVLDLRE